MAIHYEQGTYIGTVEEQGFSESKAGNPMMTIRVKIEQMLIDPDSPTQELRDCDQQYARTINIVFSDSNVEFAIKKLRYAGFEGDSFLDCDLVGSKVRLRCGSREYNGEEREDWDLMLPPMERKPLEEKGDVKKKLQALFGKKLKETAGIKPAAPASKPSAPAQPASPATVPPSDDDEIPF